MVRTGWFVGGVAVLALVMSGVLVAGPLNPPAGPVEATDVLQREADQRIPLTQETAPGGAQSVFLIAQAGSYYLEGDITGEADMFTVEIASSAVTLDLNGYAIVGVAGSFDGIRVNTSGLSGIEIRNAVVRDHAFRGVNLAVGNPLGSVLRDLRVIGNGFDGMLPGDGATVERCTLADNAFDGVRTGTGSIVRNCVAFGNGRDGIEVGEGSQIIDSVARNNTRAGINGRNGTTIRGCVATENGEEGIYSSEDSLVVDSLARGNGLSGIIADRAATVRDCVSHENAEHGILALFRSHIVGNSCEGNAAAGIRVDNGRVRVEDNQCVNNDIGIRINASRCFIAGNTCGDNVTNNWSVAAGNGVLILQLPLGPTIIGDSGGISPGTDNPYANWTY